MVDHSATGTPHETKEGEAWRGDFGTQYTERSLLNPPELDQLYQSKYGETRTALNQSFLKDVPKSASILEVGCNLGNQIMLLQQMGFENLTGIEINAGVVQEAQSRLPSVKILEGSALQIPLGDASFDLVFTSGLLIHIAPRDLPAAMKEIHRCAKTWIWGLEYYAPQTTEIPYRGRSGLLWKADYAHLYTQTLPALELVQERRLPYRENDNVDTMFLLRRKKGDQ